MGYEKLTLMLLPGNVNEIGWGAGDERFQEITESVVGQDPHKHVSTGAPLGAYCTFLVVI
jgi:hypothetical protein